MPEWPELNAWAHRAEQLFRGAAIREIWVRDEKALSIPLQELNDRVRGRRVAQTRNIGKWLLLDLDPKGSLGLNFNMGADFSLGGAPSDRARLRIDFADGRVWSVRFWFLGYLCWCEEGFCGQLQALGPDCMGLTKADFCALVRGKRNLKSLLLDQRTLSGIGNFYIHDLLFLAGLHPLRRADSLTQAEKEGLYAAMHELFAKSAALGGAAYEHGPDGQKGRFDTCLVAYREGEPCPKCGSAVQKIRAGSSHVYVCPVCQKL